MYQIMTLPNGVRIVSETVPAVRSAAVGIWVGVGSRNERKGEEGSAHFIEHMLFKGTRFASASQLAERMDSLGGHVNAFTTRESTCFYAHVLDSHLTAASDILAEMFFDSLFREDDVISERDVILDEIDMYRDTPEDLVAEQLMPRLFPGSLGRPVLGRPSALEKMTGDSLRSFKDREYCPDRIVVSVCGSFTQADLRHLADRFSALRLSRPMSSRSTAYRAAEALRRKSTEQNHFFLSWPGLADGHPDRFAWNILCTVLGGGMSSRLFQTVREKHGLCYSIGSFVSSYRETGLLGVATATGPESEAKALALIRQEVERFRFEGITADELDRAREQMKSGVVLGLESTSSRMKRLGASVLHLGRCLTVEELIERYDAVTCEDVLRLARDILNPEDMGFSALGRITDLSRYMDILKS